MNQSVITVQPMAPTLPLLPLSLTPQQMAQYINFTNIFQTAVPPQAAYINGVPHIPQLIPVQPFPMSPNCVPSMPTMQTMPPCVGPFYPNAGLAPAQHFAP